MRRTSALSPSLGLIPSWASSFVRTSTTPWFSFRADLHCAGGGAAAVTEEEKDEDEETLRLCIWPWMFWKRRGSKLFHLKDHRQHWMVGLSWDLTWAQFPTGGSSEPSAKYFIAMVVDGDMLLVTGDLKDKAYRKTKAARGKSPWNSILILKRACSLGGLRRLQFVQDKGAIQGE